MARRAVWVGAALMMLAVAAGSDQGGGRGKGVRGTSPTPAYRGDTRPAPAVKPEEAAEAKGLIDRAIRAHAGGPDNLDRMKRFVKKLRGSVRLGEVTVPAAAEGQLEMPASVRWLQEMTPPTGPRQSVLFVISRSGEWKSVSGQTIDLPRAESDALRVNFHARWLTTLLPLRDDSTGWTVRPAAAAQVEGEPAAGVTVSAPGQPDVTLYFRRSNDLLVKASYALLEGERSVQCDLVLSDYRDFSGIKLAAKVAEYRDGARVADWEVTEDRFPESFDEKTFARP